MHDLVTRVQAMQARKPRPQRQRKKYEVNGVWKTMDEWSEFSGLKETTLRGRLSRGQTMAEAISYPKMSDHERIMLSKGKNVNSPWRRYNGGEK